MKNVLFIESGVFGGGSFVSLLKHLHALDRKKVKPFVVFFNTTEHIQKIEALGISTFLVKDLLFTGRGYKIAKTINAFFMKGYLPFLNGFFLKKIHKQSINQIKNIITSNQIDFVHLNTEIFRDRVGLFAAQELRIPVVSQLRSKYDASRIGKLSSYIDFANQSVKKYVCVSEDTKKFWVDHFKIHSNIDVIYDYFETTPKLEVINYQFSNPVKILCPANLIPVKGHSFLIKSIATLIKENKITLILAGRGEETYTESLKTLCSDLGISDGVQFLGFRKDIINLMSSSDIIILSSEREGMPNAIIEAMGIGRIVIGTNVGGIPEIIKNGENGFLVSYNDESKLRNTVEDIILKNTNTEMIGNNAKSTIKQYFSREQYQSKIQNLYE